MVMAPEEMSTAALQYFYRKATAEIFEFVDKTRYEKTSLVKDQILYYSGRILSTQEFGGNSSLGEAALDLTMSTFCVPLSDGNSPIARAVVNEIHKCKILEKKAVKVAMGPIHDVNFTIAPTFYYSQVDICGPFSAYSNANKRATIKIWIVVFCCCVTSAVDCHLMEDLCLHLPDSHVDLDTQSGCYLMKEVN